MLNAMNGTLTSKNLLLDVIVAFFCGPIPSVYRRSGRAEESDDVGQLLTEQGVSLVQF